MDDEERGQAEWEAGQDAQAQAEWEANIAGQAQAEAEAHDKQDKANADKEQKG